MTTYALLAAGIGSLLPLLIAVVQQQHWSGPIRSVVGVVIAGIAAIVTVAAEGHLDLHHLGTTFTLVYGAAQVTYASFWKPTTVAPTVEAKTSTRKAKRKVARHHEASQ